MLRRIDQAISKRSAFTRVLGRDALGPMIRPPVGKLDLGRAAAG